MPIDPIVADAIDRAITIEMRFAAGLPRGVTEPLYRAARQRHGAPPGLPKGETDGPIGAAAIAHALEIGLGGKPILLSEARNMPAVIASTEAAGIAVVGEDIFVKRRSCALAIDFPLGSAAGERASRELIETYDPAAIVFVEKAGPNEKGVFHSILGTPRTPDTMANAHFLALAARDRKILTIGIADGGNEIGCGLIADAVRDVQPHGKSCGCPRCSHGVAHGAQMRRWRSDGRRVFPADPLCRRDLGCRPGEPDHHPASDRRERPENLRPWLLEIWCGGSFGGNPPRNTGKCDNS